MVLAAIVMFINKKFCADEERALWCAPSMDIGVMGSMTSFL